MSLSPTDPRMAMESLSRQELVQKKIAMDSLRSRLGDSRTHDQKLQEACEGFEAIFVQKLWEQMRKNVKKEGYLHSKDEESYQSMFDQELAKKMTSAGGIGLAQVLKDQLGQKLNDSSRSTVAGGVRNPMPLVSAREHSRTMAAREEMENLYTDLEETEQPEAPSPVTAEQQVLAQALSELETEQGAGAAVVPLSQITPLSVLGELDVQHSSAMQQAYNATNTAAPADAGQVAGQAAGQQDGKQADRQANEQAAQQAAQQVQPVAQRIITATPMPGRVHAPGKARPSSRSRSSQQRSVRKVTTQAQRPSEFGAQRLSEDGASTGSIQGASIQGTAEGDAPVTGSPAAVAPVSAVPVRPDPALQSSRKTVWPVEGDIVANYGWAQDEAGAKTWNTGVDIASAPGSPVHAAMEGTIAFAGEKEGYGKLVIVEHADGLRSYYGNAQLYGAVPGDHVEAGTKIAIVSSAAVNSAPGADSRVHFEVRRGELALNPEHVITAEFAPQALA